MQIDYILLCMGKKAELQKEILVLFMIEMPVFNGYVI